MGYEVCDFVRKNGSQCGGLYDPEIYPPVPCIFPEEEADDCVKKISELVLQPT